MKITFIAILILLIGCNSYNNDSSKRIPNHGLVIKDKCAVIYRPDSLKIAEIKKENENGFYVSADDAMYYISESRSFLDSNKVKVIETDSRIIDFYINNKLIKQFDLNSKDKSWGIILFNGSSMPFEIDITSIDSEFAKFK